MVRSSQFGGQRATKSIVNKWSGSSGAAALQWLDYSLAGANQRTVLSGAMTSATWKAVLTVSGSGGICQLLAAWAMDTTSRTLGMRVTVDGVVVFTGTTAAVTATGAGLIATCGSNANAAVSFFAGQSPPIVWNSSLVVELQSSLTETDKMTLAYLLNTN